MTDSDALVSHPGGVETFLAVSCYTEKPKLSPYLTGKPSIMIWLKKYFFEVIAEILTYSLANVHSQ